MKKHLLFLCAGLLLVGAGSASAQYTPGEVTQPYESQEAHVSQKIGITTMEVSYHRPAVKGRKIWGELVPYDGGKPIPWRGGANQNTTVSFSTDVTIEGKPLAAGTYGLHFIPSPDSWIVIFSKNSTSWGSFSYDEKEDALRVTVKPQPAEFREYLTYEFDTPKPESTMLTLYWEKLKVGVTVGVDVNKTVVENMRRELRNNYGFNWNGYNSAAMFCVNNKTNLEEGLTWADRSIQMQPCFENLDTKSQLLSLLGRKREADSVEQVAYDKATPQQLYSYGRFYLNNNQKKEALEVFEANMKRNPNHWTSYAGMARAYQASGDKDKAYTALKKAIDLAPDQMKSPLNDLLKQWQGS